MKISRFILIIISSFLASCSNVNIQNNDNLLINKTLAELLNKKEVFFSRANVNGEIVIINNSLTIDPENKRLTNKRTKKNECEFSKNQKASFNQNNSKTISLRSVLEKSASYRFKTKEENKPSVFVENMISGKVKSYVFISKPGYSANDTAIVIVSYTWSIHGALAKFIYKKKNDSWGLECSEYIIHI